MKYVDSNVFIYSVVAEEKSERKASLSKKILLKVADGSLLLPHLF
jgi:predicted nucleic acid-binding protein